MTKFCRYEATRFHICYSAVITAHCSYLDCTHRWLHSTQHNYAIRENGQANKLRRYSPKKPMWPMSCMQLHPPRHRYTQVKDISDWSTLHHAAISCQLEDSSCICWACVKRLRRMPLLIRYFLNQHPFQPTWFEAKKKVMCTLPVRRQDAVIQQPCLFSRQIYAGLLKRRTYTCIAILSWHICKSISTFYDASNTRVCTDFA